MARLSSENTEHIIDSHERTIISLDRKIAELKLENETLRYSAAFKIASVLWRTATIAKMNPLLHFPVRVVRKIVRVIQHRRHGATGRTGLRRLIHETYPEASESSRHRLQVGLVMRDGDTRPQSSAFIRLISPLTYGAGAASVELHYFNGDITGNEADQTSIDAFIVQRTAFSTLGAAKTFVNNLTHRNVRLFVDLDDALGHLDKDHPQFLSQQPSVEAMNYLISHAEQLWCSTPRIASMYPDVSTRVVRNSVDTRLWAGESSKHPDDARRTIRMVYMGTTTHSSDFELILPTLDRLYALRPDTFSVTLIGIVRNAPERPYMDCLVPTADETTYPRFVQWFNRQGPFDIGLSPLQSTEFNNAKSDIKIMDYLALGIIPVVSEVEPYKESDLAEFTIQTKNTTDAWLKALLSLIDDKERFANARSSAERGTSQMLDSRHVSQTTEALLESLRPDSNQ